ncbi:hypothetical protein [Bythopirellula goksoeyrii]|uniref:PEP-CTERM protein-sorting domain-containing protein n=1 Tax=Bythopirellula goksoeyrii TaxID=1400387 RepID=A0A5B9Q7P4_9BACT|nr:hypothetical protein [Bythopirellula goksoeyrii]QEG33689.1 hypothetical protein Pr1d_09530 [Bythopirellula goksoeyrii]
MYQSFTPWFFIVTIASLVAQSTVKADLVIDGINNFSAANTYPTSDPAYTGYAVADSTSFHFGFDGADVQNGGFSHFIVAYFGNGGLGSTTGLNFNTQQPSLPFSATHAFVYRADGFYTDGFQWNGASWVAGLSSNTVENGQFFEASLSMNDLGNPSSVEFVSYFVYEASGFESSYSVFPSTAFANGSYDPDILSSLTITAVPEPSSFLFFGATGVAIGCFRFLFKRGQFLSQA